MLKKVLKLIFVLILSQSLYAKDDGLSQAELLSVSPKNSDEIISIDTNIEIEFTQDIITKSIHKNTIMLKHGKSKVSGTIEQYNNNKLVFKPSQKLQSGEYFVTVHKVKLQNSTQSDMINYSFTIPDIQSIIISPQPLELNIDSSLTLSATAILSDSTQRDINEYVTYKLTNEQIASLTANTLKGIKEGSATIQASFNNVTSDIVDVVVYKEINGYRLPPEPDETLNNSTLLGIDSNNNGVRDDVERKVIETYQQPIKIELMMAYSKVAQKVLENPIGQALEYSSEFDKIDNCEMYLYGEGIKLEGNVDFFEKNTYNTKVRVRAYLDFNLALSGGVYGSSPSDWNADACDFDVKSMLGDLK